MSRSSLFNTLLRLTSFENKTPKEDFFTEIFARLLREPEILKILLPSFGLSDLNLVNPQVTTQVTYNALEHHNENSRPDIVIESDDTIIFIENKIDSTENKGQLDKYAEHLDAKVSPSKNSDSEIKFARLIYITRGYADREEPSSIKIRKIQDELKFVQLRWSDIYKKLSELNSDKIKKDIFFSETMNFMEVNRMDYVKPLNTEDYKVLKNYWQAKRKMQDILQSVEQDFKEIIGKETLKYDYFLKQNRYIRYIDLKVGKEENDLWCGYGFWFDNNSSEIELRVQLEIREHHRDTDEIKMIEEFIKENWSKILNKNSDWKKEELYLYGRFNIMKTEESLDKATKFFQDAFKELSSTISDLRKIANTNRKDQV